MKLIPVVLAFAPYFNREHNEVPPFLAGKSAKQAFQSSLWALKGHALNLNLALKKEHETKRLGVIVNQDISALQGIGPVHQEDLKKLGLETVRDLADYRFYHRARAIHNLVTAEEPGCRAPDAEMNLNNLLDKEYETKTLAEIAAAPAAALQGLSEEKGQILRDQFGIKTIEDLASFKYCTWAEALVLLAPLEE